MKTTMNGRLGCRSTGLTVLLAATLYGLVALPIRAAEPKSLQVVAGESTPLTIENVAAIAVADPSIADVVKMGDTAVYSVIGKKAGVTTLTVVYGTGATSDLYRIEVSHSSGVRSIHQAVGSPGITVVEIGDSVVLEGKVKSEREAERAIKMATAYKPNVVNLLEVTAPHRVKIRTRLVEVRTDAVKKLGIQYFGPNGEVSYRYGRVQIDDPSQTIGSGHGFFDPSQAGQQSISGAPQAALEARLQLLASKNLARTLAEPVLVTLSGKEASFLSGGEVPITQQTATSFTTEFKEFGVRMKVKPFVDSENNVTMHINAEASDVNAALTVNGVPTFLTRRAETEVQVSDGQTIVIGGLLKNGVGDVVRKVPWLGDIPGLGILFRSKNYQQGLSELLVFVTPEILKDIAADVANAPRMPDMKTWNDRQADEQLRQPTKPDPNWQKPLNVDELTLPEAPPVAPAATPAADAGKTEPTTNFNK